MCSEEQWFVVSCFLFFQTQNKHTGFSGAVCNLVDHRAAVQPKVRKGAVYMDKHCDSPIFLTSLKFHIFHFAKFLMAQIQTE